MERNVNVRRKGPASPRNERLEEDEEVFDYPGLEDESNGSGPVSRDAYIALRTGGLLWVLKLCQMGDCLVCISLSVP